MSREGVPLIVIQRQLGHADLAITSVYWDAHVGGIRGLIPARVLKEIEAHVGRPISEMFDLVAGTSTGGILALGLTKPDGTGKPQFTASEMCDLSPSVARCTSSTCTTGAVGT